MTPPNEEAAYDVWWRADDIAAVPAIRRAACALAVTLGFDEDRVGQVGIVASELATNVVRHAGGGELALRASTHDATGPELRILAIDSGPGRRNIRAMIADGESTLGTLGIGLGACRRIANHFEVQSEPGVGTVVEALLRAEQGEDASAPAVSSLTKPLVGGMPCGDATAYRLTRDRCLVMLADGLGHGPLAAEASRRAVGVFRTSTSTAPGQLIDQMHRELSSTRGAAISILALDLTTSQLVHAGVGNVATRLIKAGSSQLLASQPGIVGHRMPRLRELALDASVFDTAVLHSDGLTERWSADQISGPLQHGPGIVAAALLRLASGRDDAGVLTLRIRR